ncbi:hypothetical protein [Pseudaquabacterium terrae]|uniref:hypothetical protein n=1 Tax=Pseudaquabacterium terrae TaxID=2732868 RepID=UPI001FE782CC|nr:hypothetical protein [Aquabacterium terrae]
MELPDFFDQVPKLRVRDPLAELLGCATAGELEYSYADAVRLTGHSCPTVAAAYWLTWLSLAHLYPDALPERGAIRVEFQEGARSGSTGVVAAVVQQLTGAAGSTGFKGLGGRFNRAGLIRFSPDLPLSLRFTRIDTGQAVDAAADLSLVPSDPVLELLLARCAQGQGSASELRLLGELWQGRVRMLLLDLADDPGVFKVRPVEKRGARPVVRSPLERRESARAGMHVVQLPIRETAILRDAS